MEEIGDIRDYLNIGLAPNSNLGGKRSERALGKTSKELRVLRKLNIIFIHHY